jgi:hypothetical protein
MLIAVPYKIAITVDKAKKHPLLGKIYKENEDVFGSFEHNKNSNLVLTIFMMYQWQLGEKSEWFPFIDYMPEVEFFFKW